jgi:hypothetical protein
MSQNPYDAPRHASEPAPATDRRIQWLKVWLVIVLISIPVAAAIEIVLRWLGIDLAKLPR